MFKIVSIEEMRQVEAAADATGISYDQMMQNAGQATANRALTIFGDQTELRVTVLVGPGNNGGDGLVAGLRIAEARCDIQVRFYMLKRCDETDPNFKAVQEAGLLLTYAEDDKDHRVLRNMIASADLILDALFGIGVQLPLRDGVAKILRSVHQALRMPVRSYPESFTVDPATPYSSMSTLPPYVLAVDCPSGLDCDTGKIDTNTIHADETVTFIAAKPGLFIFPGADAIGKLSIAPIGVPEDLKELAGIRDSVIDYGAIRERLPSRPVDGHKGSFGKSLLVAGSVNYTGAAGLAAEAAYRAGSGLVTVGAPRPVVNVLASTLCEPTWLMLPHDMGVIAENAVQIILSEIDSYQALLLGPGWGTEKTTDDFLIKLLDTTRTNKIQPGRNGREIGFQRARHVSDNSENPEDSSTFDLPPLIIDADGLNLLSKIDKWWEYLPEHTILTPHPGEMGRLSGMSTADVEAHRRELAREKAVEWNVIIVLKGAHTLIANPDGQLATLPFKNDGLATAGTGDVLAGLIVSLLSQGLASFDAAIVGGYIHGLAGQIAAEKIGRRSMMAGDVVDAISQAFRQIEGS